MTNRELLEWLGITFADLFALLGAAAITSMFFVSDPTTDVVLAVMGVGLFIAACPFGMKRDPEFSNFTNAVKLVSYPLAVLLAVGTIIIHYVWFNN